MFTARFFAAQRATGSALSESGSNCQIFSILGQESAGSKNLGSTVGDSLDGRLMAFQEELIPLPGEELRREPGNGTPLENWLPYSVDFWYLGSTWNRALRSCRVTWWFCQRI